MPSPEGSTEETPEGRAGFGSRGDDILFKTHLAESPPPASLGHLLRLEIRMQSKGDGIKKDQPKRCSLAKGGTTFSRK